MERVAVKPLVQVSNTSGDSNRTREETPGGGRSGIPIPIDDERKMFLSVPAPEPFNQSHRRRPTRNSAEKCETEAIQ